MKLSSQIKPISYLKAHASEIVRNPGDQGDRLVITQNGEAKAVLQNIDSYEQTQETMAHVKIWRSPPGISKKARFDPQPMS